MAVSGVTTVSPTTNRIVDGAFRKLLGSNVSDDGQMASRDYENAIESLNNMIMEWQAEGVGIWTVQDVIVFLEKGSKRYYSLSSSGDNATLYNDWHETTLSADAASGAATVDLTSVTNVSDGDFIGVILADGTAHWTTVNGAPVGATVTLTDVLTGAAESGGVVYNYTTKISVPFGVYSARRRQRSTSEIMLDLTSEDVYEEQPDKVSSGRPIQVYYKRMRGEGRLYVWPTSDTSTEQIVINCRLPLSIFNTSSDTPDFPECVSAQSCRITVSVVCGQNESSADGIFYERGCTIRNRIETACARAGC